MRKPKFKPAITRVKLNPEQAVLSCSCLTNGMRIKTPLQGTDPPVISWFCASVMGGGKAVHWTSVEVEPSDASS